MATLKECCTILTDGDWIESKDQSDDGIRLIQTGNIGKRGFLEKETRKKYISKETFSRLGCTEVFPGDILISRLPDPVGRACIVPESCERMITAVDCSILRVNPQIVCKEYLLFFLDSPAYYRQLSSKLAGTTRVRISRKNLENVQIVIPSVSVQCDIVQKLNTVNRIIIARKKQIKAFDSLIKARFGEMFCDKGLPVLKWNDVFNTTTGKLDSNAMVANGEYPFFTCAKEVFRIDKYAFDQEALLLAGNNAAGKYDVKYYRGKFNAYQRTYVLGLKQDWSYRLFQYQLEGKLDYLKQQSLGGLTKYLTMKILGELSFIIPPLDKQMEFEQFVKQVDKSKVVVQKALDKAQQLFDSLMQQYFG